MTVFQSAWMDIIKATVATSTAAAIRSDPLTKTMGPAATAPGVTAHGWVLGPAKCKARA